MILYFIQLSKNTYFVFVIKMQATEEERNIRGNIFILIGAELTAHNKHE